MINVRKKTIGLKPAHIQDDMVELFQVFKIPKLKYIDVSQQERLEKVLAHWPLLEELSLEKP